MSKHEPKQRNSSTAFNEEEFGLSRFSRGEMNDQHLLIDLYPSLTPRRIGIS
jgi:hypothetical protein